MSKLGYLLVMGAAAAGCALALAMAAGCTGDLPPDNAAAGAVVDLIGPDAVNDFEWQKAGMSSSALTQWSYGKPRVAANSPRAMRSDNYFTAADAVRFLARLDGGLLLGAAATATL